MKNMPLFLLLIIIAGCNFSKSVNVNLITGLSTQGDLISCEKVFISVDNQVVNRNTFNYGETFYVNFDNLGGLKSVEGKYYPGMSLTVLNTEGDTLLAENDLYSSYTDGISATTLQLNANVTVARPIHSGGEYKLFIRIWDKQDKGTFKVDYKFSVVANSNITLESKGVKYSEIYMYNKNSGKVITDNRVNTGEESYLIFEGLEGFAESGGMVFPGLGIKAIAADGSEVLNYEDLFGEYTETGVSSEEFKAQVSSNFVFESADIKSPVKLTVNIWDKKSSAGITASAEIVLVK